MAPRKRALRDADRDGDVSGAEAPKEVPQLQRVRNLWQFANLFQWIFLFGKVVKIDESIDIDVRTHYLLSCYRPPQSSNLL